MRIGEVVDLPIITANYLCRINKAVPYIVENKIIHDSKLETASIKPAESRYEPKRNNRTNERAGHTDRR
jgi:hypothetical protein